MDIRYSTGVSTPLDRAIVISLFTWRRALPGDPVDDSDLQGWWGDSFPSVADDRIGSRLWLLRRRTLSDSTVRDAITYAREALIWLVDDGHLVSFEVHAESQGRDRLAMRIIGIRADGQQEWLAEFNDVWQVIQNAF